MVIDCIMNEVLEPIIKTNPDYHNITVCIEKQSIDNDTLRQTVISLNQEISDLKLEVTRLKNKKIHKKCNIM